MFDRARATRGGIIIQVTHKIHTRTGWGTIPNIPTLGFDPRTCGVVGARASHQTIAPFFLLITMMMTTMAMMMMMVVMVIRINYIRK